MPSMESSFRERTARGGIAAAEARRERESWNIASRDGGHADPEQHAAGSCPPHTDRSAPAMHARARPWAPRRGAPFPPRVGAACTRAPRPPPARRAADPTSPPVSVRPSRTSPRLSAESDTGPTSRAGPPRPPPQLREAPLSFTRDAARRSASWPWFALLRRSPGRHARRKRPDTVGEVGSGGGERGEAGGAGGGPRGRPEPGREALEVDRGRGGDVLQVRPGQPAVAAAAQAEGTHTPGQGALDPGPPAVAAPALLGRESFPGGRERFVLGPRVQPQAPGLAPGARAQGPRRAGAAVGRAEHHRDVGRAGVVDLRAPGRRQLPLRGAHPLPVPVDLEAVDRVAALGLGLPARVRARRTDQVDAEVLAA